MKQPPTKLTPRERRHAKQVATLLRWHKKREAAIKTLAKSERMIPRLEKALQRYDKAMVNALIKTEPALSAPTPQVVNLASDAIPEFLGADKAVKLKAPRKRKPKAPAADGLTEIIG